jgi:hypothetical protein
VGIVGFNPQLHPRDAVGKFAAKGGSSSGGAAAAKPPRAAAKTARTASSAAPNGLGYSAAQWKSLQHLEAAAREGKKLDAHQKHELHVAHEKRLAALGKPKPAKPKTSKTAAPKTVMRPRGARKPAK